MSDPRTTDRVGTRGSSELRRPGALRWVLIGIVAISLVALLAWARGAPGDDGRAPDPDDVTAATVTGD